MRLVPAAGPLRIAVLAFPDAQILDVVGPAEVFSIANRLGAPGAERYAVEVVAPKAGPVAASNGLAIVAQRGLAQPSGPIDTLVVAGGPGVGAARRNAELIGWIRRTAAKVRRVASVCTGAFLLAEAGVLARPHARAVPEAFSRRAAPGSGGVMRHHDGKAKSPSRRLA